MAMYRYERLGRRRRRRPWRRAIASVVALAIFGVLGVSVYVGWNLSHAERKPLDGDPGAYGLVYEDIVFPSAEDAVTLRGWFLPVENSDTTIVMAHGFRDNRLESAVPALALAESLTGAGFNVLMFDFRNSGLSDGTVTTLGYHEVKDIMGAVAWLKQERPEAADQIGLVGFSMGAVTAVLAAAREPAIGALVLDSPFADLRAYLKENMPVWTGLPDVPFTWTIMAVLPPLIDLNVAEVSPLSHMPGLKQPVLLIHSDLDGMIPAKNSESLAAAGHPDRTELWLVPSEKHVGARQVDPVVYDQRVAEFFGRHLGVRADR